MIAYNIVLELTPGREIAATDFLSEMETDPCQSLKLQLLDSTPMKQIEIVMKAKTPDAFMLSMESSTISYDTRQPQVLEILIEQLQAKDA